MSISSRHTATLTARRIARAAGALVLLAALPGLPRAQEHTISFEQISLERGLSQSIVICIAQDTRGFMWFGTEDGLNMYDGYSFTVYRRIPGDPASIAYNHVTALHADRYGEIWIGLFLGGLDRFDPVRRVLRHYRSDPGDPATLSNDFVSAIWEDPDGNLWIGSNGGLDRFDRDTERFTRYQHRSDDPFSLSNNQVATLCGAGGGKLWVGTDGGGLCLFDPATGVFTRYGGDPTRRGSLPDDRIRALHRDADGTLWVGTESGGLCRLTEGTDVFTCLRADPDDPGALSSDAVYAVYSDRRGSLWVGTNGGGLCLLEPGSSRFIRYLNNPNDPRSLSFNEIYAIFEDRSGVLWLGTYGGGINKFDTKRKGFVHYRRDPNDPASLSHEIVWSILEDGPDWLWIGTHGGLDLLDRKTGQYKHYRNEPGNPWSLGGDIVRIVFRDRSGTLWIGTHGGGVCRFDRSTERFHAYRYNPSDPASIGHDEIRSMHEDRLGFLWIGTNGGGLNRLDRTTGRFTRFVHDPSDTASLSNDFVRFIYEDAAGGLWIGTQGGGLNLMDRAAETFTALRHDPNDPASINSDYVFSLLEDEAGLFWIGTWGGGLVRFDRRSGVFSAFTENDGLPSNSIYGALQDEHGYLWLSTNNGLCRFDPRTGTAKNYNVSDGLQSNEFNGGSFYRSPSGEMFFGGINGFNAFFSDRIQDNPFAPAVVITSFKKLNREAPLDSALGANGLLRLSHRDYVFSFEFAALEYSAPEKNRYAYRMDNLDLDWIHVGHEKRFANYTTLPPGRYVFRVKASNNDGVWNDEGVAIDIEIVPPWWRRWWFRGALLLAAAGVVLFLYRRRLQNMRMKIELQTAHDAQMSIMPHSDPRLEGFDISGVCIPASEVGGDFYDYLWPDGESDRIGVVVGDVSGKAMQAAMIAVLSSGMINVKADGTSSPAEILSRVNRSLFQKTDPAMYTSLCFVSLDIETRTATYTLAGFPPPLLKHGTRVSVLNGSGACLPLGAFDRGVYREETVRLAPGDCLVLYTDGVIEALSPAREFYDHERLVRLVENAATETLGASAIKDLIVSDVRGFAGAARQADDITVVVIKATHG